MKLDVFPAFLMLGLVCVAGPVQAQFSRTIAAGEVMITGYSGLGGEVVIPGMIDGLPVTAIGDLAFAHQVLLTSVIIPDSVGSMGDGVFFGCSSLTDVSLPDGLPRIGISTFAECTGLIHVAIPDGVTSVEDNAFSGCTGLASVRVGDSVTNIAISAFGGCTNLTAIDVGPLNPFYSSVDGVLFDKPQTVLVQCPSGKTGRYTIPDGVIGIGDFAFDGCPGLEVVAIPASVAEVGLLQFVRCTRLTRIDVDPLNAAYSSLDGVLFNQTLTALVRCPPGISGAYTIPEGVTGILDFAFASCANLTSIDVNPLNAVYSSSDGVLFDRAQAVLVRCPPGKTGPYTIPGSVAEIRDFAFQECASLTSVTLPKSVTFIGWFAFEGCESLASVTIPDSVMGIGNHAFLGCVELGAVYYAGSAPEIETGGAPPILYHFPAGTISYYLPGAMGWGEYYGGDSTALWLPRVLVVDPGASGGEGQLGFAVSWASGKEIVVEAAGDLSAPDWTPVSTNILSGEVSHFSDPRWEDHPRRFYRLRSLE